MTTTIDGIQALERSYEALAKVAAGLDGAALARPTSCPGWDVRALLNHTFGTALMFDAANQGDEQAEDAGDVLGERDPASAVAQIATANVASWRASGTDGVRAYPFGTFPAPAGLAINVGEVALHAWDIAAATGQVQELDADVAQVVYDHYANIPMDDLRAHGVYGPEIAVPADASIQDRLLGLLSRQP